MMRDAIWIALVAAGCGGKVLADSEASGPGVSLPPLPPPCEAAVSAIDWTACEGITSPDIRTTTAIVCAHYVATKGCAKTAEAYWGCLAAQAPACIKSDGGAPGSISTTVEAPACDGARDQMSACLTDCRTAYSCEQEDWSDCRCDDAAANAGKACSAYPSLSTTGSDCNVLCSSCD